MFQVLRRRQSGYGASATDFKFQGWILDLLFPIQCLSCSQEGEFICSNCLGKISLNHSIFYPQNSSLSGLLVVGSYRDPLLKEAIHKYKYDFIKDLAEPLAGLMIKKINDCPWFKENNALLVPVPLHKKRLRWRGLNQSELLCLEISKSLNIPLINNFLIRTKHNLAQVKIKNTEQRKTNIKNTFQINLKNQIEFKNKIIILIDDVLTTGATLEECAKTLKKAGLKEIWGLVLARG